MSPPTPSQLPLHLEAPAGPATPRESFERAATMVRALTSLLTSDEFSEMFYAERGVLDEGHAALRSAAFEVIQADQVTPPLNPAMVPGAAEMLARAIHEEACQIRLHAGLGWGELGAQVDAWLLASEQAGLLCFDAALADRLDALGQQGSTYAASIRTKSRAAWATSLSEGHGAGEGVPGLWRLWLPTLGNLFALVGDALWKGSIRDRALREITNPPGLVVPVMVGLTRLHTRSLRREEKDGKMVLTGPGNEEVAQLGRVEPITLPTFELSVVDELITRGLDLLGSVTAHRVLRWEVTEGHRRAMQHHPDARALRIPGGWSALMRQLGLANKRAADEVHAIVTAQAHCAFLLPSGAYGNLLSYSVVPARGQRAGEVTIILGDALLPHYVFELRERFGDASRSAREAQRLVPMVDLPPFVGRDNEHGQQATLSLAIVTEMRARARELVEQGGVRIDAQRFTELGSRSGLPSPLLSRVLDRWTRDGTDAPAFLEKTNRDRYTLGASHAAARTFLLEAGQREQEGSDAGQRSTAHRAQARQREARKTSKKPSP